MGTTIPRGVELVAAMGAIGGTGVAIGVGQGLLYKAADVEERIDTAMATAGIATGLLAATSVALLLASRHERLHPDFTRGDASVRHALKFMGGSFAGAAALAAGGMTGGLAIAEQVDI